MIFDIDGKRGELAKLEKKASKPGFWDDPESAQTVMSEMSDVKDDIAAWERAEDESEDLGIMNELAVSENDESLNSEVGKSMGRLRTYVDELELRSWFSDPLDSHNAIVTVHPGAGGTESQDWAEMLMRMLIQWAKGKDFQVSINEFSPGEEAG
ncbi:MAG TPA: PCRF domain-containing protein, partial [Anaerolineae bacterium]|nr:PCRF domain-containing protein [Anaerolineae bacterium]